jgi:hypothetical protein
MSGDQGDLGVTPRGAVALGQRTPVGSIRRGIQRTILVTVVVGTVVALAAWVTVLAYGGVWVVHQIPLV